MPTNVDPPADVDPPIVVSGGSVNLKFKSDKLKEKVKGHHHCPDKRLKSIAISSSGLTKILQLPHGQGCDHLDFLGRRRRQVVGHALNP